MNETTATKCTPEFEKLPPGNYQAICIGVFGLGLQKTFFKGKEKAKKQVRFIWEVNKRDADSKRFFIGKTYTLSTHENSALRGDIENWIGRKFTDVEVESFDYSAMKGKNCMMTVIHNDAGYVNVNSVAPLMEGVPPIIQEQATPEPMMKKIEEKKKLALPQEIYPEELPAPDDINQETPF